MHYGRGVRLRKKSKAKGGADALQRVDKIFRNMDLNKDARLTFDEFKEGSKQDPTIVQVRSPPPTLLSFPLPILMRHCTFVPMSVHIRFHLVRRYRLEAALFYWQTGLIIRR